MTIGPMAVNSWSELVEVKILNGQWWMAVNWRTRSVGDIVGGTWVPAGRLGTRMNIGCGAVRTS